MNPPAPCIAVAVHNVQLSAVRPLCSIPQQILTSSQSNYPSQTHRARSMLKDFPPITMLLMNYL